MFLEQKNKQNPHKEKQIKEKEREELSWHPSTSLEQLKARAQLLTDIRQFFKERNVLEVETPLLASTAATHPYLRPMSAYYAAFEHSELQHCYLQTSPEFAMKRLLAAFDVPMYQICKAFRNGEVGRLHNPEFTMLEWYQPGFDHYALMDEMDEFLLKILGSLPAERLTYEAIFMKYLSINPHCTTTEELKARANAKGIQISTEDITEVDDWLDILMSHCIEPQLGFERPVMIYDFPASKAALAKLRPQHTIMVAERFEVYVQGVELANAYHELTDPDIQLKRFQEDNQIREAQGLPIIPVDHYLIDALKKGLPDSAGVALGVDRLLMLKLKSQTISDVISFTIDRV